jgi:cysteine synthase A
MALAMIEGAERRAALPGDTVVEYTGGSTGPALALVCRAKGYRALIVIADCFTEERFRLMRALGAELDVIPSVRGRPNVTAQDIVSRIQQQLATQGITWREGGRDTFKAGKPDTEVHGIATTGMATFDLLRRALAKGRNFVISHEPTAGPAGVADALRPRGVFVQGHEPASSAAIAAARAVPDPGLTGPVMRWDGVPRRSRGGDRRRRGVEMTARLAREEGVFAGISTGERRLRAPAGWRSARTRSSSRLPVDTRSAQERQPVRGRV